MRGAVIFDLDGTITRPVLDFDAIRSELGLTGGPVLEAVDAMEPADREQALKVLERHERWAAENSTLQPGAVEMLGELRRLGHPVAILTRNARRWTRVVLEKHGLTVDAVRCREDGAIKPSSIPILDLCQELGAPVERSWMVGDHSIDIQAGRAGGVRTVLLVADRERPACADDADHVVSGLEEILPLVLQA